MLSKFGLKMPIRDPFGKFLGVHGENKLFLQFYPSRNAINWDWHTMNKQHKNQFCGLVLRCEQKLGNKRTKNQTRVTFHLFAVMPPWDDRFEYCHVEWWKHPCNILWQLVQGFRSSDIPNFAVILGLAGHPNNSVSITILHCRNGKHQSTFLNCNHGKTIMKRICIGKKIARFWYMWQRLY